MAEPSPSMRIGFVSGGASSMPHYRSFLPLVPQEVELDFQGLQLYGDSLYGIANRKALIVGRVRQLATERSWRGVILTAAPTEVLNPGLYADLQGALAVPFTTALHACVAALRAYGAARVLLLTPFDRRMNGLIVDHLRETGVTAVAPHAFEDLATPKRMTPDEVFRLAQSKLASAADVDAVYFQGAVLDPLPCLERLEGELKKTVIASNPAMLWYVCSKLGLRYPTRGYGRLMSEWPSLPA